MGHWLLAFALFCAFLQVSDRASGPLVGVDHWLLAFALFCAFLQVSGLASGPLDGVDRWLLALALFWAIFPSLLGILLAVSSVLGSFTYSFLS